ncbi:hypothetical protein DIS24_g4332 [Lasiodiplodia hormozganensis]|uniref:Uncharacterized protein n=1 Tax=Lasiodiplodia hormozganensis TaxID=869390 RepID=A0AA39YVL2_9PEZI|nr:hypothetical protein DIS24_g4332 [Lasiodiplodia hormozganensis]
MATTSTSASSTVAPEPQYESGFASDEDFQHKRSLLERLKSDNQRRKARVAELRRQRKERARRRLQLQIRQQELLNHHCQMELDAEVARAQLQDDDDLTETEAEVAREMEVYGLTDPDDGADEDLSVMSYRATAVDTRF